ncbi:hypothetical protein [Dyadobacter frigoris]|uniref:Uncharacterized protein n=1 Tax=Dyadobacter frigoris TaxID=2576211 RepID=A0A4U6CPU8_9BACT|nr:hypothetical protein [Dyadobacter frigoris]TKT86502.1 hypothetical protein FDK13_31970 [Dyadobacter frigoris]
MIVLITWFLVVIIRNEKLQSGSSLLLWGPITIQKRPIADEKVKAKMTDEPVTTIGQPPNSDTN